MLTPFRDYREPRDWRRPWADAPGFFIPGCFCCAAATGTYTTFCGNQAGATALRDTDQYTIDTWTSKTDCPTPARANQATAALSGAAYTFGGVGGGFLTDNDEYVTDTWTSKTSMSASRFDHAGMTVGSYCYSCYGMDSAGVSQRTTYRYDPSGDSWSTMADGPANARTYAAATGIGTKGYTACGNDGANMRDTEEYDPSGDSWTSKTDSPTPARSGNGFYTISSKGYAAGGSGVGILADNDEYDPSGDSWTSKTDMTTARQWFGEASSGTVGYATAGQNSGGSRSQTHEEYVVDSWTSRTNCPTPARQTNTSGYA